MYTYIYTFCPAYYSSVCVYACVCVCVCVCVCTFMFVSL